MYNVLQRISSVTSFGLSALMAMMFAISIITINMSNNPDISVKLHDIKITKGRPDYFDKTSRNAEFARLTFDIDADLSSMFNWNTKQLFAYITVDYPTAKKKNNNVVIWDRIITKKQRSTLRMRKHHNKYLFRDIGLKLRDVEGAKLTFRVNSVPYFGIMQDQVLDSYDITMPQI
ncbi:Signal peptidase complex subunit [Mycoemilia scoparia]|uniref:Signal peptidase subunit 3 n=1 Tax=Mycoemilia scoparia TaxID=417184 RepID=A0A9W8A1Y8_9FUNG|nr:Signal peptidase complex subunit [Mycoemilia scoparia]